MFTPEPQLCPSLLVCEGMDEMVVPSIYNREYGVLFDSHHLYDSNKRHHNAFSDCSGR